VRVTIRMGRGPSRAQMDAAARKALKAVGAQAASLIRRNAEAGLDERGNPLAPYSTNYRWKKAGSGRNVNPVDLTLSGKLLGALKPLRVEGRKIIVGWEGQRRAVALIQTATNRRFNKALRKARALTRAGKKPRKRKVSGNALMKATFRLKSYKGKTVAYASQVAGLLRKRPFFGIKRQDDLRALIATAQRVIGEEIRRLTAK
jgi:hypothetical protein